MADHWKSIANLLGAPGVDEPEAETQGIEAAMNEGTAAPPGGTSKDVNPASQRIAEAPASSPLAQSRTELNIVEQNSVELNAEQVPDEALFFKKRRAEPESRNPARVKTGASRPEINRSEHRRDETDPISLDPRSDDQPSVHAPERREHREAVHREPSQPAPVAPVAAPPELPKTKRKSSWEALASMFSIKVDRSQSEERTIPAPPVAELDDEDDVDQKLSIFSGESSSDSNPVLDEMFADAPRGNTVGWGRPRVVDDLGWDEVETVEPSKAQTSNVEKSATANEDEDEAPRRGRRRRRGRRGRGDIAENRTEPAPASRDWSEGEEIADEFGSDAEWQEPESFVIAEDEDLRVRGSSEADASEEVESELRSSRRRRRGRGRGRDRDQVDGLAEREKPLPRQDLDVDALDDLPDEADDGIEPAKVEPRFKDDGEDRSSRGRPRRRRGGEGRREATPDRPRTAESKPVARTAEAESEPEFDFDDGEPGERGSKHRNIPTWFESIQSLVEANIENRKKNDNRGAPRGRPRGRR